MYDYFYSVLLGFGLSIVLIKFASITDNHRDISVDKKKNDDYVENEKETIDLQTIDSKTVLIDEEKFLKKSSFLLNTLGVSEDQMRDVIKKTNNDIKSSDSSSSKLETNSSFSLFGFVDLIVYLILAYISFNSVNIMTRGELGRILTGLFPTEIDSLNLREYFEKFRHG